VKLRHLRPLSPSTAEQLAPGFATDSPHKYPWYTRTDWPWNDDDWKPSPDPIRNLVKAGALIAAEIDRLQGAERR
jgi:hypothetical protein